MDDTDSGTYSKVQDMNKQKLLIYFVRKLSRVLCDKLEGKQKIWIDTPDKWPEHLGEWKNPTSVPKDNVKLLEKKCQYLMDNVPSCKLHHPFKQEVEWFKKKNFKAINASHNMKNCLDMIKYIKESFFKNTCVEPEVLKQKQEVQTEMESILNSMSANGLTRKRTSVVPSQHRSYEKRPCLKHISQVDYSSASTTTSSEKYASGSMDNAVDSLKNQRDFFSPPKLQSPHSLCLISSNPSYPSSPDSLSSEVHYDESCKDLQDHNHEKFQQTSLLTFNNQLSTHEEGERNSTKAVPSPNDQHDQALLSPDLFGNYIKGSEHQNEGQYEVSDNTENVSAESDNMNSYCQSESTFEESQEDNGCNLVSSIELSSDAPSESDYSCISSDSGDENTFLGLKLPGVKKHLSEFFDENKLEDINVSEIVMNISRFPGQFILTT